MDGIKRGFKVLIVLVGLLCALASVKTPARATAGSEHGMGAKVPSERVDASTLQARGLLPASVDLTPWAVPVGDQGFVNSCVAWTIDYGMLGWYSRHDGRAGQPFAPMYTYSQINNGVDEGSWPIDALNVAQTQGSDTWADYWQGGSDWWDQPTTAERANAAHFKISGYDTLFQGDHQGSAGTVAIENALASGHPVAITLPVRPGFNNLGTSASAVDNDITGYVYGYHAVLALAYDSNGLLIENSWGTDWANAGFGRLSWSVVENDISSAYTIDGFAPEIPQPKLPPHDVTGDGINDLIAVGGGTTSTLYVYPGNGTGSFKTRYAWWNGWNYFNTVMITPDFNGDGFNDIIGRSASDGALFLYAGNGAGGFANSVQIGSGWGGFTALVAPGDFNGDGKADLIARKSDGTLWLYPGRRVNQSPYFASPFQIGTGWGGLNPLVAPGDFNGDGKADLVGRKSDGTLWLYRGTQGSASPYFSSPLQIGTGWGGLNPIVGPGDFNGDGKTDLIGRKSDGTLWLYRGTQASQSPFFSSPVQNGTGWGSMAVIA